MIKEELHPSYVTVSLNRQSNNGDHMFGEFGEVYHSWNLRISKAAPMEESLGSGITDGQLLISVNLSPRQIAELFTNQNNGFGTCGTLDWYNGASVERPPVQRSPAQKHIDGFKDIAATTATSLTGAINALYDLTQPGAKITKGALAKAMSQVESAKRQVASDIPYLLTQFEQTAREVQASIDVRECADYGVVPRALIKETDDV